MNSHARAMSALQAIPCPGDYETWNRIGIEAIAAGLTLEDVDTWSSTGPNYKDRKDVMTNFKGITPDGGIGPGSLFKRAFEHGWKDPAKTTRKKGHSAPKIARPTPTPFRRDKTATRPEKSALDLWERLEQVTETHGYIRAKHGRPDGLRMVPVDDALSIAGQRVAGWLVVPAWSLSGELRTFQAIPTPEIADKLKAEGKPTKLTMGGTSFEDGMFVVGDLAETDRIYIVEGIGQAWACWRATGCAAVVCFGGGRMTTVAHILRRAYPDRRLVVVPDRGKEAQAASIARAVRGEWVELPQDKPANYDASDYALDHSADELEELLRHLIKPEQLPGIWPVPLDLAELAKRNPEPPRFIVGDWLPCGYATLLAGHGGIGKSGIALFLAVCIAMGSMFFGLNVERRRVLYLSCEDRVNVLHWRLSRICAYLGIDMAALDGQLDILDLVGHPSILWRRSTDGDAYTPAYGELDARIQSSGAHVIFVDGIADTFDGNENARAEVKAFVNALLALIPPDDGALVLLGHVNRSTAVAGGTGDGYSGSTGWNNSVRARWYLYPETRQGGEGEQPERTGELILELQKSNLGPTDRAMRFRWDEEANLFIGQQVGAESNFDRKQRDHQEQDAILTALRNCTDYVPAATTGTRTAFHVLSARHEFPASLKPGGKAEKRRFWRHIEAMRAMGSIQEDSIRRADRHLVRVLAPSGGACGGAGNADF